MFESISIGMLVLYITPGIVALLRSHHNVVAIIALNLLLGWTLIGWVVAFVWSLTATQGAQKAQIIPASSSPTPAPVEDERTPEEVEARAATNRLWIVAIFIAAAVALWNL